MEILREGLDLASFWERVRTAPLRLLLLDYDGTLAPFRVERDEAVPYPEVRDAVASLLAGGHTRVVVVSGRAVGHLLPLLGLEVPPEIWGSHGWERRVPGAETRLAAMPGEAREALSRGRDAVRDLWTADRVEVKPASVAVHDRGMDPARARELLAETRAAWEGPVADGGLRVHAFDGGLELRVPGRDKGTVVAELLSTLPDGAAVAYLGDDLTDEDAFRALGERGLSVLVRGEPRETAADVRIEPPGELVDFLDTWTRAAGGEDGVGE